MADETTETGILPTPVNAQPTDDMYSWFFRIWSNLLTWSVAFLFLEVLALIFHVRLANFPVNFEEMTDIWPLLFLAAALLILFVIDVLVLRRGKRPQIKNINEVFGVCREQIAGDMAAYMMTLGSIIFIVSYLVFHVISPVIVSFALWFGALMVDHHFAKKKDQSTQGK